MRDKYSPALRPRDANDASIRRTVNRYAIRDGQLRRAQKRMTIPAIGLDCDSKRLVID